MTSTKAEIERLCEAEGNPPLLQEWGAPLRTLGVMNSVGFLSQHEGLRTEVPTAEGVISILISLRAIIGAQFPSLTQLIDAGSDAGADTPEAGTLRAQARASMVMLHMLAVQQKTHCVNDQLASTGLGDSEARLEAESRRKKENASRAAATMRDAMTAAYNKPYTTQSSGWRPCCTSRCGRASWRRSCATSLTSRRRSWESAATKPRASSAWCAARQSDAPPGCSPLRP